MRHFRLVFTKPFIATQEHLTSFIGLLTLIFAGLGLSMCGQGGAEVAIDRLNNMKHKGLMASSMGIEEADGGRIHLQIRHHHPHGRSIYRKRGCMRHQTVPIPMLFGRDPQGEAIGGGCHVNRRFLSRTPSPGCLYRICTLKALEFIRGDGKVLTEG